MSRLVIEDARSGVTKMDVLNTVLSFGTPTRVTQDVRAPTSITVHFPDPRSGAIARRTLERYLPLMRERLGPQARVNHSRSTQ